MSVRIVPVCTLRNNCKVLDLQTSDCLVKCQDEVINQVGTQLRFATLPLRIRLMVARSHQADASLVESEQLPCA